MRASRLLSSILCSILFPLTESTISAYLVPYRKCKETIWGCCVFVTLGSIALHTFPAWPLKTLRLQVQAGGNPSEVITEDPHHHILTARPNLLGSSPSDAVRERLVFPAQRA